MRQSCPIGLTNDDVIFTLGGDAARIAQFWRWMMGQTTGICDGRQYDHERGVYLPSDCAAQPHGIVVYAHDVKRFLAGQPVID